MIKDIEVEERKIPKCPVCGTIQWRVYQRVEKSSSLKRVDGFKDLVVEVALENDQTQSLALQCLACERVFQPQNAVGCKVDAYDEQGGENHLAMPARIVSEALYSEGEVEDGI